MSERMSNLYFDEIKEVCNHLMGKVSPALQDMISDLVQEVERAGESEEESQKEVIAWIQTAKSYQEKIEKLEKKNLYLTKQLQFYDEQEDIEELHERFTTLEKENEELRMKNSKQHAELNNYRGQGSGQ